MPKLADEKYGSFKSGSKADAASAAGSSSLSDARILVTPISKPHYQTIMPVSHSNDDTIEYEVDEEIFANLDERQGDSLAAACKTIWFTSFLEFLSSAQGTVIWTALSYANSGATGSFWAYILKTPFMGIVPNFPGVLISTGAEWLRSSYISDPKERKAHAWEYFKVTYPIFAILDYITQILQDFNHFLSNGFVWEYFADPVYDSALEVSLNILVTLVGISALHYALTALFKGKANTNFLESLMTGVGYFCFFGQDDFLNPIADSYGIDDVTMDYTGSAIGTGLAMFTSSFVVDMYRFCQKKKKEAGSDELESKSAESVNGENCWAQLFHYRKLQEPHLEESELSSSGDLRVRQGLGRFAESQDS